MIQGKTVARMLPGKDMKEEIRLPVGITGTGQVQGITGIIITGITGITAMITGIMEGAIIIIITGDIVSCMVHVIPSFPEIIFLFILGVILIITMMDFFTDITQAIINPYSHHLVFE